MAHSKKNDGLVRLGPRLIAARGAEALYASGMGLVEEVAAYLDGPGREQSTALGKEAAFLYARESMRLTTRLMQVASWLLLQRAIAEGELTADSARAERDKMTLSGDPVVQDAPGYGQLPAQLRDLIERADALFSRVAKLDAAERGEVATPADEGGEVAAQMARLHDAFGRIKP